MDETRTAPRSTRPPFGNPMLRELRNPLLAALGVVLYGGCAVVLAIYFVRPDLRPSLAPIIGSELLPIVLMGYVLLLYGLSRRRARQLRRGLGR